MAALDRSVAELLNRIAQHQPLRLLAAAVATYLVALPILVVLWLVVGAVRRRKPRLLSVLALATLGALAAVGLNLLVGHLYFRPRRLRRPDRHCAAWPARPDHGRRRGRP